MIRNLLPIVSVGDICLMRPPLSLERDTPLRFAMHAMNLMEVEAAGIVDNRNCLIGFITSDDLLDYISDEGVSSESTYIEDIMRPPAMAAYLDDPVEHALILMKTHKINWLPVVNASNQHFAGLLCRDDLEPESASPRIAMFAGKKFPREFVAANAA